MQVPPYPECPEKGRCELGGGLMREPMQTPDGHVFDRPVLEDWVGQHGTNPVRASSRDESGSEC